MNEITLSLTRSEYEAFECAVERMAIALHRISAIASDSLNEMLDRVCSEHDDYRPRLESAIESTVGDMQAILAEVAGAGV